METVRKAAVTATNEGRRKRPLESSAVELAGRKSRVGRVPQERASKERLAQSAPKVAWLLVFFSAGIVVCSVVTRSLGLFKAGSNIQRETNLLLAQQIDQLATHYLDPLAKAGTITADGMSILRTWEAFDQRFVELNEGASQQRFEVAIASKRLGFVSMLMGNYDNANGHLHSSLHLLRQLQSDNPNVVSYQAELVVALVQLANLGRLRQDSRQAIEFCEQAISELRLNEMPASEEYDDAMKVQMSHISRLLASLGERERALEVLHENAALLERLVNHRGEESDQMLLEEVQQSIEELTTAP